MINSCILTTKQYILYLYCKEKVDFNKLAGAERVKCKSELADSIIKERSRMGGGVLR